MTCQSCGTEWFSRVATLVVAQPHLARCAKCGGVLTLTHTVTRPAPLGNGEQPHAERRDGAA
jgi:uncharacterized Zn finger protein